MMLPDILEESVIKLCIWHYNQGKAALLNNVLKLPTAQLAGMFKRPDLWPEGWYPSWDVAVYLRYLTRIASVNIQLY